MSIVVYYANCWTFRESSDPTHYVDMWIDDQQNYFPCNVSIWIVEVGDDG